MCVGNAWRGRSLIFVSPSHEGLNMRYAAKYYGGETNGIV